MKFAMIFGHCFFKFPATYVHYVKYIVPTKYLPLYHHSCARRKNAKGKFERAPHGLQLISGPREVEPRVIVPS
jgi:hypothetical protein